MDFKGTYRHLKLHTRLVIKWSLWLIAAAMVIFALAEWTNPISLGGLSFIDKIQAIFFQAVTLRTAGFSTLDFSEFHMFTLVVFTVFMFIVGRPAVQRWRENIDGCSVVKL
ncbi:MAG: potassium transporter TrkG [Alkalibacterium sp.]|nr:potassium transporter TrkG [Alkalibacterium sp.]